VSTLSKLLLLFTYPTQDNDQPLSIPSPILNADRSSRRDTIHIDRDPLDFGRDRDSGGFGVSRGLGLPISSDREDYRPGSSLGFSAGNGSNLGFNSGLGGSGFVGGYPIPGSDYIRHNPRKRSRSPGFDDHDMGGRHPYSSSRQPYDIGFGDRERGYDARRGFGSPAQGQDLPRGFGGPGSGASSSFGGPGNGFGGLGSLGALGNYGIGSSGTSTPFPPGLGPANDSFHPGNPLGDKFPHIQSHIPTPPSPALSNGGGVATASGSTSYDTFGPGASSAGGGGSLTNLGNLNNLPGGLSGLGNFAAGNGNVDARIIYQQAQLMLQQQRERERERERNERERSMSISSLSRDFSRGRDVSRDRGMSLDSGERELERWWDGVKAEYQANPGRGQFGDRDVREREIARRRQLQLQAQRLGLPGANMGSGSSGHQQGQQGQNLTDLFAFLDAVGAPSAPSSSLDLGGMDWPSHAPSNSNSNPNNTPNSAGPNGNGGDNWLDFLSGSGSGSGQNQGPDLSLLFSGSEGALGAGDGTSNSVANRGKDARKRKNDDDTFDDSIVISDAEEEEDSGSEYEPSPGRSNKRAKTKAGSGGKKGRPRDADPSSESSSRKRGKS